MNATTSQKNRHAAPRTENKYKVAVRFINNYGAKESTVSGRDSEHEAGLNYRMCTTFNRARTLVNRIYGADSSSPKICYAAIYLRKAPAGTPPVAIWTPQNQWNNVPE